MPDRIKIKFDSGLKRNRKMWNLAKRDSPMTVDADLLRFSSESTESQNQAGLLAHPNLPPSHSEFVSGQWLFVTNRLWITPQGLQLRGQLRHLPNSLLIPRAQMRDWEPISVANIASFSR